MARRVHLHDIPEEQWADAERRLSAVRKLVEQEPTTRQVVAIEATRLGISATTLYELISRYRENPSIEAMLPRKRGAKVGTSRLPDEAEALIDAAIRDYYLSNQKPNMRKLVVECSRRFRVAGISDVPAYRTIKARVDSISAKEQVMAREGKKAADDRFRPVVGHYHADYALEVVQYDHTLADVMVVDETHRQPIQRPWVTFGIDVASRAIVGHYLTLQAPSSLSIAMAVSNSVLPKEPMLEQLGIAAPYPIHGLMSAIHVDNAKEFHARALVRGCIEYDIELLHRPVRTPHYGGHIERLIGTMMGEMHLLPGTTFSNIADKGEYNPDKEALMTLRELDHWLAIEVIAYNGRIHRSHGLPPLAAYQDAVSRRPKPIQLPADPIQFFYDFLPFEMRYVGREGLQINNIHYWDNVLSVWVGKVPKKKMLVRYDPRNLSRVFLCDPEGRYWPIPYRDLSRPAITLWEYQRTRDLLRQRGRTSIDENMLFDAVIAQRMIVAEAAAKTKQARRTAQRTTAAIDATSMSTPQAPISDHSRPLPDPNLEVTPEAGPRLPFAVEEWN